MGSYQKVSEIYSTFKKLNRIFREELDLERKDRSESRMVIKGVYTTRSLYLEVRKKCE